MTAKSGDSTEVRFEGESGVKGNSKELNRGRGMDDLAVDVFIFQLFALSPFKGHSNRFGAA